MSAPLPPGRHAMGDWVTATIAAGGLLALIRFKISNPVVVVLAAIFGWVAFAFMQPNWLPLRQ